MFSAIKKAFGRDEESGTKSEPRVAVLGSTGIQQMDTSLQRRFARGIQYNMKIVIRGDRNTGKSSLFQRLKGHSFSKEYLPTEEIQVGIINWSYKTTDDVVKVEVWDVVDHGKQRNKSKSLKVVNTPPVPHEAEAAILDAQWVDVYQGTHGVVMTIDITKTWTLDYVKRELPKVPSKIPVLVLANFRDLGPSRTVCRSDFECLIEEANISRGENAAVVRFAESSMKTAFGLKYLHKFFNIPFLLLQRESLELQLKTNNRDMCITERELEALVDSEEQNYDVYCNNMSKRNINIEGMTDQEMSTVGSETPISPSTKHSEFPSTQSSTSDQPTTSQLFSGQEYNLKNYDIVAPENDRDTTKTDGSQSRLGDQNHVFAPNLDSLSISVDLVSNVDAAEDSSVAPISSIESYSRTAAAPLQPHKPSADAICIDVSCASASPKAPHLITPVDVSSEIIVHPKSNIQSLDDFIVDDGIESSFLDDNVGESTNQPMPSTTQDEDSDSDDDANPMVAADQEDLDPEDWTIKPKALTKDKRSEGRWQPLNKSILPNADSGSFVMESILPNADSSSFLMESILPNTDSASKTFDSRHPEDILETSSHREEPPNLATATTTTTTTTTTPATLRIDPCEAVNELEDWLCEDTNENQVSDRLAAPSLSSDDESIRSIAKLPVATKAQESAMTQSSLMNRSSEDEKDGGETIPSPFPRACDESQGSNRLMESKKKEKKEKQENEESNEDLVDLTKNQKKKKKHVDGKPDDEKKRNKSAKKNQNKPMHEKQQVLDSLGTTAKDRDEGDYELL